VDDLAGLLHQRALPVLRAAPTDGAILQGTLTNVLVRVPPGARLPLASVRMKWNWRWTDSSYDPVRGVVVCAVPAPLKPSLYTAQVHAWDARSNHYAYAWLFQYTAGATQAAGTSATAGTRVLALASSPGRQ
jgi:hypothetical protein